GQLDLELLAQHEDSSVPIGERAVHYARDELVELLLVVMVLRLERKLHRHPVEPRVGSVDAIELAPALFQDAEDAVEYRQHLALATGRHVTHRQPICEREATICPE